MKEYDALQLRSERNVSVYKSLDGDEDLTCAATDCFVLLKDIAWPEMQTLVSAYADQHDAALLQFFLKPANTLRKSGATRTAIDPIKVANQHSPEALSIAGIGKPKVGKKKYGQIAGEHCLTPALAEAVDSHGLLKGYLQREPTITPAWHVILEPFEVQLKVAETMVRPSIREMRWAVPSSHLHSLASARVLELLEGCSSTEQFLRKVCGPLVQWFADPVRKGIRGAGIRERRPMALAWFATWLAERGVLLFPMNVHGRGTEMYPPKYRYFLDEWLRPTESVEASRAFLGRVNGVVRLSASGSRDRTLLLLRTLNLAAPGLAVGRVAAPWLKQVKDSKVLVSEEALVISAVWRLEAARLKSLGIAADVLHGLSNLVIQKSNLHSSSEDLWGWVDNPETSFRATRLRYARKDFQAGPNLRTHVAELRGIFPAIAGSSGGTVSGHMGIWLYFLSSLKDEAVPPRVVDIKPGQLEALFKKDGCSTLRGFMVQERVSEVQQRNVFSALKRAWKISARQAGEHHLLCPISDQLLSMSVGPGAKRRSTSTTRRAIDMEILDLLVEENRANDFAFSRSRRHSVSGQLVDARYVADPETGAVTSVWWPGVAVLMDVLLQIPLRNKQGRYLDSGEGDEFELDIDSLELRRNLLPTAEPRRQQAFIQRVSISPLRDEPGLGMYVNTNKTGRDYTFPWLLHDIAVNVRGVVEWQRKYNPIAGPVSDREDTKEERAANVDPIWVYPIFRDPMRQNNRPLSAQIIRDYFRALLKHVEDKYNLLHNTSIRFFRADGEPVYDIHALRVTGVTRLLSMGVEPRVVRLLVGHASLTMTWYYDHVTNQRVAAAMAQALELHRPSREALFAMGEAERDKFLGRLFNRSDQPSLSMTLLRGILDEREPFLDVRTDGICPGQSCAEAGVWRHRACSLCKYNVTGAAFLAGLELVLNDLMAELILNQQRVASLRDRLYELRREGVSTRPVEAELVKREEFVDNLLRQWEAQFQYVKRAEADLAEWLDTRSSDTDELKAPSPLPKLLSPSAEGMGLSLRETHHLALYTRLIEGAKQVEGFMPTLGAREARDGMLLEIARHENKTDLFYRLDPDARRVALDQFALLLLDQELEGREIEGLIDGSASLSKLPGPSQWLDGLALSPPDVLATTLEHML